MNSPIQRTSSTATKNRVSFTNEVSILVPSKRDIRSSPSSSRVPSNSDLWSVFSPHSEVEQLPARSESPVPVKKDNSRSPEQRLTLVAFRLAVLEKFATGVGKLAFVWATVVLLGGFVSSITAKDFWITWVLLLTEGTRVFSRSSELEWQQANYSLGILSLSSFVFDQSAKTPRPSAAFDQNLLFEEELPPKDAETKKPKSLYRGFGAKRTWSVGAVPFIPYVKFFPSRIISLIFYFLQLSSATTSVCLSVYRLVQQDFDNNTDGEARNRNFAPALTLFYVMMCVEASLFLLERAYWEFKLRFQRLLERVARRCELDADDIDTMKQYWYAVYSRSLNGSVFDGLNLDLIDFTVEKLQSSIREEQLGSVNVLSNLVSRGVSREETRRRIGTTPDVVERLLEMITWKDLSEAEIRKSAILVIKYLVRHRSNCFRISAVPGSLEGITSILVMEEKAELDEEKKHGLTILNRLAADHRTCVRIGNTSGLVSILVSFIHHEGWEFLKVPTSKKIFKRSLELLRTLASVGGDSGRSLRIKIASVVSTIRSLQRICELQDLELKDLAVDILKMLAIEDELRGSLGATGGVMESLMSILTAETTQNSEQQTIAMRAGEAIFLLVLQSPVNCSRLLKHRSYKQNGVSQNFKKLVNMLSRPDLGIHAATILRSLCNELKNEEKLELGAVMPDIIKMVIESDDKEQQAAIGLAAVVIPWLEERIFEQIVASQQSRLCGKITELLSQTAPPRSLNRIRRYSVELFNSLVKRDAMFLQSFRSDGKVQEYLEAMIMTASDEENFLTFSGAVGLTKHSICLEELINIALFNLNEL